MQKRIKALEAVVSQEDKVELVLVNNAFVAATRKNKEQPTATTLKEWRHLKEDLESLVTSLSEKYEIGDAGPLSFAAAIDVHRYLLDMGWKVSRSQFYEHIRERLLQKRKGVYTQSAVDRYAKKHLRRAETGMKVNDRLEKIQDEKLELELRTARVKLEKEEHDLNVKKRKFVSREDHELAIVSRAVAFMAHLNHTVQQSAPDWIDIVGGDQKEAPALVAAVCEELEQRMGDFAADVEFDVILEAY